MGQVLLCCCSQFTHCPKGTKTPRTRASSLLSCIIGFQIGERENSVMHFCCGLSRKESGSVPVTEQGSQLCVFGYREVCGHDAFWKSKQSLCFTYWAVKEGNFQMPMAFCGLMVEMGSPAIVRKNITGPKAWILTSFQNFTEGLRQVPASLTRKGADAYLTS